VAYFLSEIFPLVRARVPQTRLRVTGRTQGVDLARLPLDGVELTGYVDDVRPVVAGSMAAVTPLRLGGGTRLKILEAMALGVPVVSTPKGVEGLDVQPGEHLLLGRTPAEFAEAVVRVLQDPALRQALAAQAVTHVRQRYDWEKIGDDFCRSVECVLDGPFTG
jgi:glycosyltransferase involved in cell wall biosynthesis